MNWWVNKFGPEFAHRLKRRHTGFGDTYYLDEVFVKISGKQHYAALFWDIKLQP